MPPARLIMKLTSSGVTSCAAQMRSPSFSRSSSSATMIELAGGDVRDGLFHGVEGHGVGWMQRSAHARRAQAHCAYGRDAAAATYLPSMSASTCTRSPAREVAERGVPPGVLDDATAEESPARAARSR